MSLDRLAAFPGPGPPVQVSTTGGSGPVWTRDGRLIYRGGGKVIAATLVMTPSLLVIARTPILDDAFVPSGAPHANHDVSPDGRKLLALQGGTDRVVVVHNWRKEVHERIAADRGDRR